MDPKITVDLKPVQIALGKLVLRRRCTLREATEIAALKPGELYEYLEHEERPSYGKKTLPDSD